MKKNLKNSSILITGGTGSFGNAFVQQKKKKYNPKRLVIFSRDEFNHQKKYENYQIKNKLSSLKKSSSENRENNFNHFFLD